MFKIYGGGAAFRQWEQGYVLTNDCMNVGDEVVFRNSTGKTIPVNAREEGGAVVVDVPNELLMDCSNIVVELGQGSERHHECFTTFEVERCDKPSGYVCKPNEYRAPTNAPDWNQNNPSGAGYIKNRTHWVETEMISEDFNAWNERTLLGFPMFDVGDTVTVYVDGVEYSLKAYEEYNDYGRSITIGDTGNELGAGGGKYGWKLYAMDGTVFFVANKACTVSYPGETIHKIDPKYLPKVRPVEYCENESYLLGAFNELLGCLRDSGYMAYEDNGGGPI